MKIEGDVLKGSLEALLMAAQKPMTEEQLLRYFEEEPEVTLKAVRKALASLQEDCALRGVELRQVASGYRFQVKTEYATRVARLWEEKPTRYSRALLETLALIAYRQPITRGEIEDIRGVAVSTSVIKNLEDREWIRMVGHRDVPGRPALFATTRAFLDYFGLNSLEQLPLLPEAVLTEVPLMNPGVMEEQVLETETLTSTIGNPIDESETNSPEQPSSSQQRNEQNKHEQQIEQPALAEETQSG
jgi:segregation and condensation protein B